MTTITPDMIKKLRVQTGAGMLDCKKALEETAGNMEKAFKHLREQGIARAEKRASRNTSCGVVSSYIHGGGRLGVLVEVNCETDFVARNEEFAALVTDIAMHIAALQPRYVARAEVPTAELEQEREVLRKQAISEGKPAAVVDRMVEGRLRKYCQEICLLDQTFVKDSDKTVGDLLKEHVARFGENISVRRFVCFVLGEGASETE